MGDKRKVKNKGIQSDREKIILFPSEYFETSENDECWGVEKYSTGLDFQGIKLEGEEQLSSRSFVIGWTDESEYCVPPGKHEFDPDIKAAMSPKDLGVSGNSLGWSFALRVETTD